MAKVLVIGATGETGMRLCRQLVARRHEVIGLHRKPEQYFTLKLYGVEPVLGDLLDVGVSDLTALMRGVDVVVFVAKARNPLIESSSIDHHALVRTTKALIGESNARLIVACGHAPQAITGESTVEEVLHYSNRREAEIFVASSELDWVCVRVGALSNAEGNARVQAGLAMPHGLVPRDDLATVIAELVDRPDVKQVIMEVAPGLGSAKDAVRGMVRHSTRVTGRYGSSLVDWERLNGFTAETYH